MISYINDIKKAFEKLCSSHNIPTDGILSAVPGKHGRNIIITLDLSQIKNDDLWMDIQTVERKLKKTGFIDAKVNWECVADETRSYQFPKSLTLTVPNSNISVATIETMYNSPANNSQAGSNKDSSERNNGAGHSGNGMHSFKIRQPRKSPIIEKKDDELLQFLKRPQSPSAWIRD